MRQPQADRLLGMLVTIATGIALLYIQHQILIYVNRKKSWKDKDAKKASDYGDPYFRARWGHKGYGLELVRHKGRCMCGRFCFRLLAPADLKALDCPGRVRYPHIFVPAAAFQPMTELRQLTLYSARSAVISHVVVHAFCNSCGVPIFRASDGAIDTLVVNVECLESESIRSLEVTYYEDLLGFPPDECTGSNTASKQPISSSASKAAARSSSSSPSKSKSRYSRTNGTAVPEDKENMSIVPISRPRKGGRKRPSPSSSSSAVWFVGEAVEHMLPLRVFGHRPTSSQGGSALVRTGLGHALSPTSLLSSLVSKAADAVTGGRRRYEARGGEEGEQQQEGEVWRAWDDSCTPYPSSRNGRWGGGWGGGGDELGGGSNGGAVYERGGGIGVAEGGGISQRTTTSTIGHGGAWERLDAITPPSMYQLRYHLKRHLKRHGRSLNSLDSDDERGVTTVLSEVKLNGGNNNGHHHYPQQQQQQGFYEGKGSDQGFIEEEEDEDRRGERGKTMDELMMKSPTTPVEAVGGGGGGRGSREGGDY